MSTKLEGKKWVVENYTDKKDIVVETSAGQSVYIYNIKGSVVQIKGKIAAITVDKASKSGVVFEHSVGSAEVVNSSSLQLQGHAPSYTVDKSQGITLFLSLEDTKAQIFSSLASEININVLEEGKDPKETSVPSQFVTSYEGGKWVTKPVEHVGV